MSEAESSPDTIADLSVDDERYLRLALAEADAARNAGDPPFGSVIVDAEGKVLATARNTTLSERDVAAHPEMTLARWVSKHVETGAASITMYTSCQPCVMCDSAIVRAGLGRVVFALSGEQLAALKAQGPPAPETAAVNYIGPALPEEARRPFAGFYTTPDDTLPTARQTGGHEGSRI